jgi:SAM-dependent methyltransferase
MLAETYQQVAFRQPIWRRARRDGAGMGLDQVRADWTRLGAADPLWAVLVSPEHRHGRWDAEQFLATGRSEIDGVLRHLSSLGVPLRTDAALDFGCGAGRLSAALSRHFGHVVGVDISPTMLAQARELVPDRGVELIRNDRADLAPWADATFDLTYSSLVLQHLPTALALGYLGELVRVLRRGGVLVAQLATTPDGSVRGRIARVAPRSLLRVAQQRILRYPAPMDMHPTTAGQVADAVAAYGGTVVDAVDEPMYGGHWRYRRYYVVRR